jgi:hypothetical protein
VENPPKLHDKGGTTLVLVCLFGMPIYQLKVHGMCIYELEALLDFKQKSAKTEHGAKM